MTDRLQAAEQLRRCLQMFAQRYLTDEEAIEIATVYPEWKEGVAYKDNEFVTYGTNDVGDPQLYKVIEGKAHTSQKGWEPDVATSLFNAIGLNDDGYPLWSQPTGAHDAYGEGDIVDYNGTLYISKINGNDTVPGTDDRWWEVYTETEE